MIAQENKMRRKSMLFFAFTMEFLILSCSNPTKKNTLQLPPPKHGNVYVVAHRGAHNGIPENSLPAYKKAIELGVDFIEVDIRVTKDGRIVSMHNNNVGLYARGVTGRVQDFTLTQLRELDIGSRTGPEWKETRIPTLEEILDLCKGKCGIYLDLKNAPVPQLVGLLKKYDMERHALWYSPFERFWVFNKLASRCPDCIPMPDPLPHWLLPLMLKTMNPQIVATVWDQFSKEFADKCHKANAIVIVDESDPSCWQQALAWGADGIQTDHPAELIAFLQSNK